MIRRVLAGLLLALLLHPAAARALPLAVVGFLTAGFTQSVLVTIGTFIIDALVTTAVSYGVNKIFGPKSPKNAAASAQDRQASINSLTVGEVSRELLLGECATGGSLAGAFNYGGQYGTDWVVRVIVIADHRCHSLTGFYVGDVFVPYVADGEVDGYSGQLVVHWRDGQAGQSFPADLMAAWRASPLHADTAPLSDAPYTGLAYVVAAAKADAPDAQTPVWSGSLPQLLFQVKGKLCYDPRKDGSEGGSGAHRWADPATWEWTRNAAVCRYNWVRGVYALDQVGSPDQLLVGRGLSTYEAPPANVFAYANLCDEAVDDGAGGTEPRYLVDGVIRATDSYLSVEQMFEAAMAGQIIQPQGGVEVEPGQAKTPVFSITDADLVVGAALEFNEFGSDADRINTVIPRYIEPSQKWSDYAAPVQRDMPGVALDGPREYTLPLSLVTRATQAQRVGQIYLQQKLLERTARIVLPPARPGTGVCFAEAEEGDWIEWTSARHTRGEPVLFRIVSYGSDQSWQSAWALQETSFDAFGFGGSPVPAAGGQLPTVPPGALRLFGVNAQSIQKEGASGSLIPAIRMTWTAPVDAGIGRIRAEVREAGRSEVSPTTTEGVGDGVMDVTSGVGPDMALQARLVPLGAPGRAIIPSAWINVTSYDLVTAAVSTLGGLTVADYIARADAAVAQGDQLVKALLQVAANAINDRDAMIAETFHNGQRVRKIVIDDGEDFTDGAYSIAHRLNLLGLVTDGGGAFQFSDTTLKVSPTETFADYRSAVVADIGGAYAAVGNEASARASDVGAVASSLSSVSTTVGGHSASITALSTSLNGLEAQYILVVDSTTHQASIQAYAGGSLSTLIFTADAIGLTDGSSTHFPFTVSGGVVRAHSIEVDTLAAGSVTINGLAVGAASAAATLEISPSSAIHVGAETSCGSLSFTTSGSGKVRVDIRVRIDNASTGDAGYQVVIYVDGADYAASTFKLTAGPFTDERSLFVLISGLSAGSHTFESKIQASGGSVDPTSLFFASHIVTELRKAG